MLTHSRLLGASAWRHSSWRLSVRSRLSVGSVPCPISVAATSVGATNHCGPQGRQCCASAGYGALCTSQRWSSTATADAVSTTVESPAGSDTAEQESAAAATDNLAADGPRASEDASLIQLVQEAVPLGLVPEILEMIKGAKNAREVRHLVENVVFKHHLCFDILNGRGYRATVLQALTPTAVRTQALPEWFACAAEFRRLGFVLTRAFAADAFSLIRSWLLQQFNADGRAPYIVTEGIAYTRELMRWCHEDGLVFDHVLYTRIIFILTMMVSFFDRQNLHRASFPADFAKRDGVVVEWVVGVERSADSDECVLQCDAFLEEVLESMRQDLPCRPTFSVLYRLMDYYFATDNLQKMLAVMEDAQSCGVGIAESSTAKLMQLACFLGDPRAPQLFLQWRASMPQCVLAAPDMSRLMFYYGRAGGGRPCPVCGEVYNHRHPSVYVWQQTPPHQRQCPALQMARRQKGELEECRALPQNADWSEQAFALWEASRARAIEWGAVEWRAFLLCCIFSPRALEARALVDRHCEAAAMDDFLRATYVRLLRHHAPEEAVPTLEKWERDRLRLSPIVLQEALMAAAMVADSTRRLDALHHVWEALQAKDSYVMPFTKRFFERRRAALQRANASLPPEEVELLDAIVHMKPRRVSLLELKDSASDFVVGVSKKNVYHSPDRAARGEGGVSSGDHVKSRVYTHSRR